MSLGAQSILVVCLTFGLFCVVPPIIARRGQFFWGALAAFFIQFMPLVWQAAFTDSDAPGFGLLLIFITMPISVLMLVIGIANLVMRRLKRRHKI
jgi:hypothetical protein